MKSNYKTNHISKLNIPNVSELNLDNFDEFESSLDLNDPFLVREFLVFHFLNGEHDTFFEILALYMDHVGKAKVSIDTQIPERTIYNFINGQHKTSSVNIFKVMKFITQQVQQSA